MAAPPTSSREVTHLESTGADVQSAAHQSVAAPRTEEVEVVAVEEVEGKDLVNTAGNPLMGIIVR